MSAWEDDYLDEEVEAFIEFLPKGGGSFQFGYVSGRIDHRTKGGGGKLSVEFSWEGGDGDDGTAMTGRGTAELDGAGLKGMLFIHEGDDSEFVAKKNRPSKSKQ